MNKQLFEKAADLDLRIQDVESAIITLEENKSATRSFPCRPLEISFTNDDEYEALRLASIKYLKSRNSNLKKQFDNLK